MARSPFFPPPNERMCPVTFRIPPDASDLLARTARQRGTTKTAIMRAALADWFERHGAVEASEAIAGANPRDGTERQELAPEAA